MFLDFHYTEFIFRSLFDLLDVVPAFRFPFLKSSNHLKTFDTGLKISQSSENVWEVLRVILRNSVPFWCNIVSGICITMNHSSGPLRLSCLHHPFWL